MSPPLQFRRFFILLLLIQVILLFFLLGRVRAGDDSDLSSTYEIIDVASRPEAVAVGDLNNDGKNDVVVTTSFNFDPENDYHIFIFLQNDSGKLDLSSKYSAGNGESVDIGDLNNDGKNDIVVTDQNGIGVFLQNDNGTLTDKKLYSASSSSVTNSYKTRTGDFNNDGLIDVVSMYWGTQSFNVDIYLQNKYGTLNSPVAYRVKHGGFGSLEVGDVNNDGLTDIVILNGDDYSNNPDHVAVLLQNQLGIFENPVYYNLEIHNNNAHSVTIGDINNDLKNDVVVTCGGNRPSSSIVALYQNVDSSFNDPVYYSSYDIPEPVVIVDIDNDSRNDVVVLHGGWDKMGIYYQNSSGIIDQEILYQLPHSSYYNSHGISVGDLNDDGLIDIVIADMNHGLILFYSKKNKTVPFLPPIFHLIL